MRWYVIVTYCVPGALCGEALGFLGLFPRGGSKRGLGWRLKVLPFASLGSGDGVGWCITWLRSPDEGGRAVLTFAPNKLRTTPRRPTCHPERSGTTHQKSSAPTNHRRTANPAPSGAPAGGISVAPRHHTTPRTIQHPRFDIFFEKGLDRTRKILYNRPVTM